MVLAALVAAEEPKAGSDFFPLTVEFRERYAAAGHIPGGYIKREGRLADHEILASRLVDRSLRPLFPRGYHNEIQIMTTVMSQDPNVDADVLAVLAAGLAAHIAPIPFHGPVAAIRTGRVEGKWIAYPTRQERALSDLDLVISSGPEGLVMVEGEAKEVPEAALVDALTFAQKTLAPMLELMERWAADTPGAKPEFVEPATDEALLRQIKDLAGDSFREALLQPGKLQRRKAAEQVEKDVLQLLVGEQPEREPEIVAAMSEFRHHLVRGMIAEEGVRLDGRATTEVRPITIETGWLPCTHGSALFTRGETQAMVTCTLGALDDAEKIERLFGPEVNRFMLHYNFPSYSVGEIRPMRGPGRREIGHGNLAHRALNAVIPKEAEFPYCVRVVSDISESNGSSSMATVCGGSLALMDAGVPIRKAVAGVAMGLISEAGKIAVLTDILGDEDHLGDMDFKVAGTADGITAVQMDNKVGNLSQEILAKALEQARQARLHVLSVMNKALSAPRPELPPQAPRAFTEQIRTEKIRDVIGPGGRVIQDLQRRTNTKISIEDDGAIRIYAPDAAQGSRALQEIRALVAEPETGKVYRAEVISVRDFGAIVKFLNGHEGLVHISELAEERTERTGDVCKEGDEMLIRVLGVDRTGRLKLSRRAALNAGPEEIEG